METTTNYNSNAHWYALRTFHNKATAVCRFAEEQQVEWYTPIREEEVVVEGETEIRRVALMPQLLFLKCNEEFITRLRQLTSDNILPYCTPGTSQPHIIEESEMELFRFATRTAAATAEYIDPEQLTSSDKVRITGGMFAGYEGYIRRVHGTKRFIVAIEGIAAVATTYIPRQHIERIG